jgi:hypothetical protein
MGTPEPIMSRLGFSDQNHGVNRSLAAQQRAEFCCSSERSKPPWISDGVPVRSSIN